MQAVWKVPGVFKGDANRVAAEVATIESVTPESVLEYARNPESELHLCFEWDDAKAAEKYRKTQARGILLNLVIVDESKEEPEQSHINLYYNTGTSREYKLVQMIVNQPDEYQALLKKALSELEQFKKKYACLSELSEIMALIA